MEIRIRDRIVTVEYQTVVIATAIFVWALYYYFSIMAIGVKGVQSVLFIKPVTILLALTYPFAVFSAIKIRKITPEEAAKTQAAAEKKDDEDRGFFDPRRVFFVGSLALYAVALTFFGYLIPSIVFILVVCYYLGVRNFWLLALLSILLPSGLTFIFKALIKVPVPLWF